MGLRIRIREADEDGSRPLMSITLWIEEEMGNHIMNCYYNIAHSYRMSQNYLATYRSDTFSLSLFHSLTPNQMH